MRIPYFVLINVVDSHYRATAKCFPMLKIFHYVLWKCRFCEQNNQSMWCHYAMTNDHKYYNHDSDQNVCDFLNSSLYGCLSGDRYFVTRLWSIIMTNFLVIWNSSQKGKPQRYSDVDVTHLPCHVIITIIIRVAFWPLCSLISFIF